MDPGGVLPRRTFTIRTENGVLRRISQEEMRSLVRSRIQQARALASRRTRESHVTEPPSTLQVEGPQANAESSGPPDDHPSSWGGRVPQRARTPSQHTAAFQQSQRLKQQTTERQDALVDCDSRYDETPLVQKHFSWSSVEDSRDDSEAERDDASLTERCPAPAPQDRDSGLKMEEPDDDIVELDTDVSEEGSGNSSAGEVENQQGGECGQHARFSPNHTSRPQPETPVYNNRVLLDNVVSLSRSLSTSPKHSASTPLACTPAQQKSTSTHSTIACSPTQEKTSSNTPDACKKERQEQRKAKVESLLRMSLDRVRDRAKSELGQMLEGEEEQTVDLQRTLSMTAKEIDQVVQDTVRKAREAAQEELSELLKESVQRARESAEQEILNLVQMSMSRVKSRVNNNGSAVPTLRTLRIATVDETNEDKVPRCQGGDEENTEAFAVDETVCTVEETPAETDPAICTAEENPAKTDPVFEMNNFDQPSQQHDNDNSSFGEDSGFYVRTEQRGADESFAAGSPQSPLFISESLEEAAHKHNSPWTPMGAAAGSGPMIQVEKQLVSRAEAEQFFPESAPLDDTAEWPYFEHTGSKAKRSSPRHAMAFPKKSFPTRNMQADEPQVVKDDDAGEAPMTWHTPFSTTKNGTAAHRFPIAENSSDGFDETQWWPSGWPSMPATGRETTLALPPVLQTADSSGLPDITSDISLGSEPPQATEKESANIAAVLSPKSDMAYAEELDTDSTVLLRVKSEKENNNEEKRTGSETMVESATTNCGKLETDIESYKQHASEAETKEVENSDFEQLYECLTSDTDIPFDEPQVTKYESGREFMRDPGLDLPETSNDEQEVMHEKSIPDVIEDNAAVEEEEDVEKINTSGLPAFDVYQTQGLLEEVQNEHECSCESLAQAQASVENDCAIEEEGRKSVGTNNMKVSFREETSPIPPPVFEYTNSSEGLEGEEVIESQSHWYNVHTDDVSADSDNELVLFGENTVVSIKSSLSATQACSTPQKVTDPETYQENVEVQSPQSPLPTPRTGTTDLEEHHVFSNDETHDSKRPSIRQLESNRGESVISPLSLPTEYTSDECTEKDPLKRFTASFRDNFAGEVPSPCRSLPSRQAVVGVLCTNFFDAVHPESFETQTITSLRTPSVQTFDDALSLDDNNSYLTSAVETWMESVADTIEGNTRKQTQQRHSHQRQPQQKRKKNSKRNRTKEPNDFSYVAREWLWALGERLDVAVDHINDALGAGDRNESEAELDEPPLLSELKRPSFSFSDGEGKPKNVGHIGGEDDERGQSTANANKASDSSSSSQRRGGRSKTRGPRKTPTRRPMRSRRRSRGRSRVKREV